MSDMHWNQMNCELNNSLTKLTDDNILLTNEGPQDYKLPLNFHERLYYKINDDVKCMSDDEKIILQKFIKENNCTDTGNVTELSDDTLLRMVSTQHTICLIYDKSETKEKLIGCVFSLIFRLNYNILSSYTTNLCVHKSYRNKGIAMILIRAVMKHGYKYNINHGYYMTFNKHHSMNKIIPSWFRPINLSKAKNAGYSVMEYKQINDRNNNRQKLAYKITKPKILPIKLDNSEKSYELYMLIISNNKNIDKLMLTPTYIEFKSLCKCFDIYVTDDKSLFMLFPMTCTIGSTNKNVNNCHLSLMIGNVIPQVLWIANEMKYDLLYGWISGDITEDRVKENKGLITVAQSYLEMYNTKIMSDLNDIYIPIF